MTKVCYEIRASGAQWNPLYQQSYLYEIGWNAGLLKRVSDALISRDALGNEVFTGELFESVVDTIDKLGMLYLGQELLAQEINRPSGPNQTLIKFHFYHLLYDCVACIDSLARIMNAKFDLGLPARGISFNNEFLGALSLKDEQFSRSIVGELVWTQELREIRNTIIHREGRMITDMGDNACVFMDFGRMLERGFSLNKVKLPDLMDGFILRIDALCLKVISMIPQERPKKSS